MIGAVVRKIFGSKNEREVKKLAPTVQLINSLEPEMQKLTDEQLKNKTMEFRERLTKGETLDDLLPEAFAVVREAAKRVLGQRHYDVQLIGGMVLHSGKIAEMKTGEGKTLVGTLPVYLNALSGKGVHVVTVNDYLARRDSEWMGRVYNFLGMSVGVILHDLDNAQRKHAYGCDITYGTNNEFGFDYLRDNMKYSMESMVQRDLNFAIVDEVDSILIDEARTPLIISGPTEDSTDKYYVINQVIPRLKRDQDFTLDEEHRSVMLTDDGVQRVEKLLGLENLYDARNIEVLHHVNQALRAHTLYKRDVEYVVKDGEVVIVDEFTGRLMPGRRWSDGLHQAVEAKEGVTIENENQTLATITFQNYFRMYNKLAGMTGTADTEAGEFHEIYKLDVVVIPTNKPLQRKDTPDIVYKGEKGKFKAIAGLIEELHAKKQPILVGTVSIEKSEKLSDLLKKKGIPHTVLNAKMHEKEAEIVAQAGRLGAVTISTNMAGRGTDIMLGGNAELLAKRDVDPAADPERYEKVLAEYRAQCEEEKKKVLEIGGLAIIGTERHESRRIDNQLRGRAGRQGDPGLSRFYLSLEDDLLRIFGADRMTGLMERLGMEEDEPIEHGLVTRAIENAQKKVEGRNFDIRKHLLEYDQVMSDQRTAIYAERRKILLNEGVREIFASMLEFVVDEITDGFAQEKVPGTEWEWKAINEELLQQFGFELNLSEDEKDSLTPDGFYDMVLERAEKLLEAKETEFTTEVFEYLLRQILITSLDHLWKDHLLAMDHLREGINLRAYGQKDPKQEYKKEGHEMFQEMIAVFRADVVEKMCKVQVRREVVQPQAQAQQPGTVQPQGEQVTPTPGMTEPKQESGPAPAPNPVLGQPLAQPKKLVYSSHSTPAKDAKKEPAKVEQKVGRNEPCPCGSGKKYKQCHGKTAVTS